MGTWIYCKAAQNTTHEIHFRLQTFESQKVFFIAFLSMWTLALGSGRIVHKVSIDLKFTVSVPYSYEAKSQIIYKAS